MWYLLISLQVFVLYGVEILRSFNKEILGNLFQDLLRSSQILVIRQ